MNIIWPEKKEHNFCQIGLGIPGCTCGAYECNKMLDACKKAVSEAQDYCKCKVPEIDHNDTRRIHGSRCINCHKSINIFRPENKIEAQPSGLVALDEKKIIESFKQFLEQHTCNWILKQHYVLNATYFKTWIHEICSTFGTPKPRAVVTVDDIYIELCLECGNEERGDLLNNKEKEIELKRYAQAIFNRLQEEGK